MPWDTKTNNLTLSVASGNATSTSTSFRLISEKFPLIRASVSESADNETFTIKTQFAVEEEGPWTDIETSSALTNNGTYGIVDLSTVSGKPSGAPYLNVVFAGNNAVDGSETATATVTISTWVDADHGGVNHL